MRTCDFSGIVWRTCKVIVTVNVGDLCFEMDCIASGGWLESGFAILKAGCGVGD